MRVGFANRLRDVFGSEPAGDEDLGHRPAHAPRDRPGEGDAGTAGRSVEQDAAESGQARSARKVPAVDLHCRVERQIACRLRQLPVELERGETHLARDAQRFLERSVLEDADEGHLRGQRGPDAPRLFDGHAAPAVRGEDYADLVRAGLRAEDRVLGPAHAAELDAHARHARTSPRVAASGSAAEESASPTSSASAPSFR